MTTRSYLSTLRMIPTVIADLVAGVEKDRDDLLIGLVATNELVNRPPRRARTIIVEEALLAVLDDVVEVELAPFRFRFRLLLPPFLGIYLSDNLFAEVGRTDVGHLLGRVRQAIPGDSDESVGASECLQLHAVEA